MIVDLTKLLTNQVSRLVLDGVVEIPKELMVNSLIHGLSDVKLSGEISFDEEDNIVLSGKICGVMLLNDDVTLEPVEYHFGTEIEEILNKSENKLDITDILWQNILVEIPSKVRSTDEDIELSGDGWRVISEEKYNLERNKMDNPFQNLNY